MSVVLLKLNDFTCKHLFRYLKVPSPMCTGVSSGESVVSSSSRDLGVQTPDDMTSDDSSVDDMDEGKRSGN